LGGVIGELSDRVRLLNNSRFLNGLRFLGEERAIAEAREDDRAQKAAHGAPQVPW
jgi:hypothetical protein